MSHSSLLSGLAENLVPFYAQQVSSSLLWCAADVEDPEALRNACSYLIDPARSAATKKFYAERYGGSGIQRNGGGARCGFDGHYQVKGMGANPLVGKGSDERHSNGTLSAVHALYEALWSEVLGQILPYGAVQTRAVLLIDNDIANAGELAAGSSRRALLIREPVVRPAHFERAPYFRPQPDYAGQLLHDARRVSSVIRQLPISLPMPPDGFSERAYRDPQRYCIEGLCELARRQARQMAFCRTRFLRLTTSPSNISMDGKLLDFNGLNCLFPDESSDSFEYHLRLMALMKEPATLQKGLSNLCLYAGKYLFDPGFTVTARQQTEDVFQQAFQDACYRGYLELLGITIPLQKPVPETLKPLVKNFVAFIARPGNMPYRGEKNRFSLENIVTGLIQRCQGQRGLHDNDLEEDNRFPELLRSYTDAIGWLTSTCHEQGVDNAAMIKEVEQSARQKLLPRACLGKVQMFEEIAHLLKTHEKDIVSLRQAFVAMGIKMQTFANDVLGSSALAIHGHQARKQ
ncbi:MchC protein [Erwinia sp. PsM31]|uniref:MchC protein n=1 Tax=Erwinia sp. PsM31 TaxID=3030535 RepID=UPI00263AD8C1|nr:MchC protein [Erwinia sp. PsM31]MDN4629308.1 MchC protein [Erwinia sp. PsM31]